MPVPVAVGAFRSVGPEPRSVAALSLVVGQSGKATTRTVVLLTPEEMDAAAKKTVAYRPPGG